LSYRGKALDLNEEVFNPTAFNYINPEIKEQSNQIIIRGTAQILKI
jgi:hypothetical protein